MSCFEVCYRAENIALDRRDSVADNKVVNTPFNENFLPLQTGAVSSHSGTKSASPLALLAQLLTEPDETLDLAEAALLIASAHYVDLDIPAYLTQLDAMTEEARFYLRGANSPAAIVETLRSYVGTICGFAGDAEDYYNPANSFLNEVLDRRAGLPITLSLVYLALAHRLNLPLAGVGMPLHFVVKYVTGDGNDIVLDPFHGGEVVTPEMCQARIERIAGRPVPWKSEYLGETPKRAILYRLLNNLKQIYVQRDEPGRAGRVVEQMMVVRLEARDLRDRGLLLIQENALTKGVQWLEQYLAHSPAAPDGDKIRETIQRALVRRASLN